MKGVAAIGESPITPFIVAAYVVAFVAFLVGWLRGGHPERFGVAVLLFHALAEDLYGEWRGGDGFDPVLLSALSDERGYGRVVLALIFAWLAFRSPRWWPLAVTASLVLIVLVHLLQIMTPIPHNAAASARVGLWLLVYTTLLFGAFECWMAGEAPVSRIGRHGPSAATRGP